MPVTNRVTNSMLINNFNARLSRNMRSLDKLQGQLATNRKFQHISDDPISLIYSQEASNRLRRIADYKLNLSVADQWMAQVESSILELNDVFKSAYEAVIDASTDVKNPSDRINIAKYIAQLRDQVLDNLNATTGNKYVFGGYNTTGHTDETVHPPFAVGTKLDVTYDDPTGPTFTGIDSYAIKDAVGISLNGVDITNISMAGNTIKATINGRTFVSETITWPTPIAAGSIVPLDIAFTDDADPDSTITLSLNLNDSFSAVDFDNALGNVTVSAGGGNELFYNGVLINPATSVSNGDVMNLDLGVGVKMDISFNGLDLAIFNYNDEFGTKNTLYGILDDLYNQMISPDCTVPDVQKFITPLQEAQNHLLQLTAEVGGRTQRIAALEDRYGADEITYTEMKSLAEDCDQAEVIMYYKMAEATYKAALSTGAYIIQNTLMDFLR